MGKQAKFPVSVRAKPRTKSLEGQERPRFSAIDEDGFCQHFSATSWNAAETICGFLGWDRLGKLL